MKRELKDGAMLLLKRKLVVEEPFPMKRELKDDCHARRTKWVMR